MIPALLILTGAQIQALNIAFDEGSYYGIGKTFMAVVLVESSACVHTVGDDGRSWGCSQLQVYTARQTCSCNVSAKRLRTDKQSNLRIGAQFLSRCFNQFWPDTRRSIYCYNAGIPAASKASASQIKISHYVDRVLKAEKQLAQVKVDTN